MRWDRPIICDLAVIAWVSRRTAAGGTRHRFESGDYSLAGSFSYCFLSTHWLRLVCHATPAPQRDQEARTFVDVRAQPMRRIAPSTPSSHPRPFFVSVQQVAARAPVRPRVVHRHTKRIRSARQAVARPGNRLTCVNLGSARQRTLAVSIRRSTRPGHCGMGLTGRPSCSLRMS